MGNTNLNNDQHLKLCIIVDKDVYTVGEVITGSVLIRATSYRPYQSLYINIAGHESVSWSHKSGNNREPDRRFEQ